MTDQNLFEARVPVFPKKVSGKFRSLKWVIMVVTLGIYYITPWIRWDRGPALPDQAVLVDIANRRFFFFWIEIWPHEFYFVAGLLIMAGLGLFLFTSALGRVWCGYACPQTVWTDLFILVERWIEGDRNARVRLHKAKWSAQKWRLRLTKWTVWLLIAVATGGAWVFYFTDAPTLLVDLFTLQAHAVAYTTVGILTLTTFVFGGIAREQICIYACPWPRIQAAMVDQDTLTVGYRDWRGEPRGKHRKGAKAAASTPAATAYALDLDSLPAEPEEAKLGDCIDCMACVNVCPMGIDIRDGQQMECITCALCIDACDDMMTKIGKPTGLIDYLALSDEPAERAGEPPRPIWHHVFRKRTIMYTAIWSLMGVLLVYGLFVRTDLELTVAAVRNPVNVVLSDGSVRNTYDVRLRNKTGEARQVRLSLTSPELLRIELEGSNGRLDIKLPPDTTLLQRVYLIARPQDPAATTQRTDLRLWVEDIDSTTRASRETTFTGRPQ